MEKKKRFLEDAFDKLKENMDINDLADIDLDSDIPVTEKKTKERKFLN